MPGLSLTESLAQRLQGDAGRGARIAPHRLADMLLSRCTSQTAIRSAVEQRCPPRPGLPQCSPAVGQRRRSNRTTADSSPSSLEDANLHRLFETPRPRAMIALFPGSRGPACIARRRYSRTTPLARRRQAPRGTCGYRVPHRRSGHREVRRGQSVRCRSSEVG